MSDAIDRKHPGITDEQRAKFLEIVAKDKAIGIREALKQAGVWGTGGERRTLFRNDEDLQEDARLARGWNINRVEGVTWEVALDKEHSHWDRANARLLKAYGGPQFRDKADLDVNHNGEIKLVIESAFPADSPDVVEGEATEEEGDDDDDGTAGRPALPRKS